jgi:hypothetical protein
MLLVMEQRVHEMKEQTRQRLDEISRLNSRISDLKTQLELKKPTDAQIGIAGEEEVATM